MREHTPNSILCDYNTFVSAELFFEPVFHQPIWDSVHCLVNIVESTILSDKILMPFPSQPEALFADGNVLNILRENDIVHILDIESEPIRKIQDNLINNQGKQILREITKWICKHHSEINNFAHYFPVFACNSWVIFDHDFIINWKAREGIDALLWGKTWAGELESEVSDFSWGFGSPPESIRMPQLAMYFLVRGFVYNELSKVMEISYLPHPFRAAIVLNDALVTSGAIPSFNGLTASWLNNLRSELITSAGKNIGSKIFEAKVPALFAIVLRECSSVDQIIQTAIQIRETETAKQYRRWINSVMERYLENRGSELIKELQSFDTVASNIRRTIGLEKTDIEVGAWIFSIPITAPRFLHKPILIRPHLRFLRDAVLRSIEIVSLRSELKRLGVEPKTGLTY